MTKAIDLGGPIIGDAFGLALLDYLEKGTRGRGHIIERDDGLIEVMDPGVFFAGPEAWAPAEGIVQERAGDTVLDIGAGAGHFCLALQESGRDVVGLDVSPGAIEVCRRRGVDNTFLGTVFDLVAAEKGPFDTFLLCGNNYGLLESAGHGPRFLDALRQLASPGAEIIGTGLDPFDTDNPLHLAYHELNRGRGRLPGQLRLRARWANVATEWFDYLFVPVEQLEAVAATMGWHLVEHVPGGPGPYLDAFRLD